jgi:hypothetical protein
MTQLLELNGELTKEELEQVKSFAEFLMTRRRAGRTQMHETKQDHKISFEGWLGCLAHVHPEMSDAEFKQFILDERVREAMK